MRLFCLIACVFVLVSGLFSGCSEMPNDGIPFYLRIDSVSLSSVDSQGANTHNITDVWVEANSTNLGVYELPCNFPVLEENDVRLRISAGIWVSGQQGSRVSYPFYSLDTATIVAQRGGNYTYKPRFKYIAAAQFSMVENFNFSGNGFDGITLDMDSVMPGYSPCAVISVGGADSNKIATSMKAFDLPENYQNWLELDYKCTVPFYIGFYGLFSSPPNVRYDVMFVNPKAGWNKLYVNLSDGITYLNADSYRIYFEALKPQNVSGGKVYIDNVKLIHF